MQIGRSKAGSVSVQKFVMETMMQTIDTTANTLAALELSGSSHSIQTARCQSTSGRIFTFGNQQKQRLHNQNTASDQHSAKHYNLCRKTRPQKDEHCISRQH